MLGWVVELLGSKSCWASWGDFSYGIGAGVDLSGIEVGLESSNRYGHHLQFSKGTYVLVAMINNVKHSLF
jgi:hypothetical protein